jgi:hypothetical protein
MDGLRRLWAQPQALALPQVLCASKEKEKEEEEEKNEVEKEKGRRASPSTTGRSQSSARRMREGTRIKPKQGNGVDHTVALPSI